MKHLLTVQKQWNVLFALTGDETLFGASDAELSKWSVGEQLSHVVLSLSRMGKYITTAVSDEALGETNSESETRGSGPNKMGRMILTTGFIPRGRGQAPKFVIPKDRPDRTKILEDLNRAHATWTALVDVGSSIQASKTILPHHLLGDFTAAHWVRFAGVHTKHHLKIIFDILESNGLAAPSTSEVATPANH